jgi:hypothetical protein
MQGGTGLLTDRREVLAGAVAALRDLHTVLFQCGSGELGGLAGDLAELRAVCGAQLVGVVAEAEARGVAAESQHASTTAWVADHAWHSRREASTIAGAARLLRRAELGPITDAVLGVDIDPAAAVVVGREYQKLAPDLIVEARPFVLEKFVTVAAEHGPSGARRLREEILATYGREGEFDDHTDRCRRHIDLSSGRETSPGVWEYALTVDGEGRAVVEATIGPLSAPRPDRETGARDPRPVGLRRGQALIEALRRSVTATQHVPTSPKAVLMVTMNYQDLAAGVGAGTVLGSRATGTPISPTTIRRLACDAALIPTVLGAAGEILDQGRLQRLFTTAQTRTLWLRDRHCTFPHCDVPAAWCDCHHLVHWLDGGRTDLDNAALLCPRHHTITHRDRLAGTPSQQGVSWDTRPGTYQPPDQHRPQPAPPTLRMLVPHTTPGTLRT